MTTRRILTAVLTFATLSWPTVAQEKKAAPRKRPNILFIMSDDHASASIGAYGSWLSKATKTPNLDRLAKQGVRFTNALVVNSICTPSRAAILTGQYSHKNGVYTLSDALSARCVHLGQLLQRLGYRTALVGKWHLKIDPTGFDYWNIFPGQGVYHNPKLRRQGEKKAREYKGRYATDVVTDLSLDWLKQRDKSKPFFLCCHYKAPHRPWDPAPRFKDLFKDVEIPEPPTLQDDLKGRAKAVRQTRMTVGEHMSDRDLQTAIPKNLSRAELRRWAYQQYMKRYLACVAAVDENVGRLLAFLEREGLTQDTIVVYTSDQGFFLGEHGFFDKRLMYEPCLTTPLIVRWPGHTRPGSVNTDMVLNIDHAPTFLDIVKGDFPKDMQGRSYRTLLEGRTPADWRHSMYYRYWMHLDPSHNAPACYGVRTDRYTLVHYYGKGMNMKGAKNLDRPAEWELFDLKKDPQQVRNVYADPNYATVLRELRVELDRLRKEVGDER